MRQTTRPSRTSRLALVALPLALLLGACGSGDLEAGSPASSEPPIDASGFAPGRSPEARSRPKAWARSGPAEQALLHQRLRDAAWDNDVTRAARLIRRGANVNAKDDTQQSAYLIAASEGHLELLRLMLRHGARVDAKDSWNGTGLIRAAERGHALVVGELLRAGTDPDHVNRIGYQAIHEAVWLGAGTDAYATTIRVLAAGGVALERRSPSAGLAPLQMARQRRYAALERTLVAVTSHDQPADPDQALLKAAAVGNPDAVAVALRAGAHIEARDGHDRTALLLAVTHDHVDVARVLVAMGADPDALDDRHDSPWLVTGVTGSVAMLETLLPAHPDLALRNRFGGLSPIPASERGHVDYVRRVVRTDVNHDHVNDLGWTALPEAVIVGDGGPAHREIVQIHLDAGAAPDIADHTGLTVLDHAERRGFRRIAELLRR